MPTETTQTEDSLLRFSLATQRSRAGVYCLTVLLALFGKATRVFPAKLGAITLVAIAGFLSCIAFYELYKHQLDRQWKINLAPFWLVTDTFLITGGVFVSGGWDSPWFIWYLSNSAAAAFVLGARASLLVSTFNAAVYMTMLMWTGSVHLWSRGFWTAIYQIGFLYVATFFFLKGTAILRQKREIIQTLKEAESRKVEELTVLTQELDERRRELAEANRRIREGDRLKSQFLANMSHELRTPMNSIIGFSEILQERLKDRAEPKELTFLHHILVSGKHLLGIINDVLDLSKIEAGKMEIHHERFAVGDAVESVIAIMRSQAARDGVRIESDVPPDLPIESDLAKFKQILFNLVSNAVKFSPADALVKVSARPVTDGPNEMVEVTVLDTGPGIAPENHEIVFQEFRQIENPSKRSAGGTGLGLALVKKFVELQGGSVSLISALGKGSSFSFRMPAQAPTTSEVQLFHDPSSTRETFEQVLVVEDDASAFDAISRHLQSAGYSAVRAGHGEEAMRLARLLRPVAITLDLVLPGMDGWELLKKLKLDPETCDIPVVIVSMIDNRELGIALGAHDYFLKPVDRRRLIHRIQQFTSGRTARQKRLLLIDDDPAFQALLEEELQALGYEMSTARSGEQGVALAQSDPPDVIILDLLMPDLSGFRVADLLKAEPRTAQIPILVMTSKDITDEDRRQLQSKIEAVLPKGHAAGSRLITAIQQLEESGRKVASS